MVHSYQKGINLTMGIPENVEVSNWYPRFLDYQRLWLFYDPEASIDVAVVFSLQILVTE